MANIGHRSTQRVMEILELIAFSGVEDGFSLTQVATVLKCPKSSISPILHTLAAGGYLSYDQAQMKYTIGRRLFEEGATFKEYIPAAGEPLSKWATANYSAYHYFLG